MLCYKNLGPILFTLYISPIGQIISSSGISHQQYADDARLYIALNTTNAATSIHCLETCLMSILSALLALLQWSLSEP